MRRHFTKKPILASNNHDVNREVFKLDTDTSYYNNFLNEKDLAYMQKSKNRTGEVVYMSPSQYYEECATKIFDTTVAELKRQRRANSDDIQQYMNDMLSGDRFPLCYLNYADRGQEGLHRMMAAGEAFGWDTKFPVLIVRAVDDKVEKLHTIWRDWVDAVYDAEQVTYDASTWEQEFIEEVEYNLERETGEHHEVVIVDRRDLEECKKYNMDYAIEICLAEFQDIMSPNTVFEPTFRSDESTESEGDDDIDDDIDIDDIDIEDLEDDLFVW